MAIDLKEERGEDDEFRIVITAQPGEDNYELLWWWIKTTVEDIRAIAPKITAYGGTAQGSADLQLIGENLATLLGMHDAADAVKQEMGCWFYMQGKIARLVSDYQAQREGHSDTWLDASVYAMMARRIQEAGRWP